MQQHLQTGVALLKLPQHLRQPAVQHGADKAHVQMADQALVDVARMARGFLRLVQQRPCLGHEGQTGSGQAHLAAAADEQFGADRGFELLDVQAQRRLRDRQAPRRAAEVQLFGQGEKVAQVAEFHDSEINTNFRSMHS